MHEQPEQPGGKAAEFHLPLRERDVQHGHRRALADGGQRAVVEIAESLCFQALHAALDVAGGLAPHLFGAGAHTGHGRGVVGVQVAAGRSQVTHHADVRVTRDAQVRLHHHAAGAVQLAAGAFGQGAAQGRCGHASGPHHRARRQEVRGHARLAVGAGFVELVVDAEGGDVRHLGAGQHLGAQHLQLLAGTLGQVFREGAQHARRPLQQDDAGHARVDAAELGAQGLLRDLGQRAGHLHARGARTHHGEGQPGLAACRVGFAFGLLEGGQHAAADGEGVAQGLEAGGVLGPVVAPEIAVRGAGGQDEVVEMDVLTAVQHHAVRGRVDGGHLAHQHRQVAARDLIAQDVADGRRDGGRRQAGRGHLVEQGLEKVVVGAVDDDDFDVRVRQGFGRLQATEAATDDDHPLPLHRF